MSEIPNRRIVREWNGRSQTAPRITSTCLTVTFLSLLLLLTVSCSVRPEVVKPNASLGFIPFPKPPDRVEIEVPWQPKKPGVTYVEQPLQLKPSQVWRAYKDGALVWKPRDWRGVNYVLTEWPRWADAMQDIINQVNKHNKSIETKPSPRKWYEWR